ncbi:MAG: hypothetical protein Q7R50_01890 [Dehalococcoidales bacterium]|nr:hypothetical protein [Dehalococcoidales bacterium]
MMKSLKRLVGRQNGQALPIVLCLLAVGGLTIAASLNFSTYTLNGTRIVKQNVDGIYAAGAGVEYNLWAIKTGNATLTQLPQQINDLTVNMSTYNASGFSTLYINNMVSGGHSEWYQVNTNITAVGGNTYNVTITITADADAWPNKNLSEMGAVLPLGYTYVNNSTSVNPSDNITPDNPTSTGYDSHGSCWVKWTWQQGGSQPSIVRNMVYTEKFQITGTGATGGLYAWIDGGSRDIGVVGQITGALTTINATAIRTRDGKIIARIYCQALAGSSGVYILSWRVTN